MVASINPSDPDRIAGKVIIPEGEAIIEELKNFRDSHRTTLPENAIACLARKLDISSDFKKLDGFFAVQRMSGLLGVVRAELDFHLADHSAVVRSLTERALSHLQRSLIADKSLRDRWKAAFKKGEEECEKLGAVHLLLHGIWAFKAHATDKAGRTDLVLGTQMNSFDEVERTSEGLVLTEWKKVKGQDSYENCEPRKQYNPPAHT